MINLVVERKDLTNKRTIGDFFLDGVKECFSIEDAVREKIGVPVEQWKVPKQTAIPAGRYRVFWTRSNRFSAMATKKNGKPTDVYTLELFSVPGFAGIRIHAANDADDVEGCIGVGETAGPDGVYHSKVALEALEKKVVPRLQNHEECWITVENPKAA